MIRDTLACLEAVDSCSSQHSRRWQGPRKGPSVEGAEEGPVDDRDSEEGPLRCPIPCGS